MTKLFEQAIAKVQNLPDEEQDILALQLMAMADAGSYVELDEETRKAVEKALEECERGEFASDAEVAALWKRHGL